VHLASNVDRPDVVAHADHVDPARGDFGADQAIGLAAVDDIAESQLVVEDLTVADVEMKDGVDSVVGSERGRGPADRANTLFFPRSPTVIGAIVAVDLVALPRRTSSPLTSTS
jgi:hypothetical protein